MNSIARHGIFNRLRKIDLQDNRPETATVPEPENWSRDQKIQQLCTRMEAMRTQVHVMESSLWPEHLKAIALEKQWKEMICGTELFVTFALKSSWNNDTRGVPKWISYSDKIESFKDKLFSFDAGLTTTMGAVADTGAVILWPTPEEPRLLSLVPPVHIALVDADSIYASWNEAIKAQGWKDRMPSNALLISGPSKTADIEFTLVLVFTAPKR